MAGLYKLSKMIFHTFCEVQVGLGQKMGVLLGVVESVVSDLLHVVPVRHNAVLNWDLEDVDSSSTPPQTRPSTLLIRCQQRGRELRPVTQGRVNIYKSVNTTSSVSKKPT